MESIGNFITWLSTNAGILSIVVAILLAVVPTFWSFIRYLNLKNKEIEHDRFKIFHELIKDLVQPDTPGQSMALDRQIAIIYELRNFSEYFEVTRRMLSGLKKSWNNPPTNNNAERLIEEIDLTIEYINAKKKPNK